jgi:hypothetical protein
MIEFFLMTHVLFGMLCIVMAVWVFVDVLNISETNYSRIKIMTYGVTAVMWLS